MAKITTRKEYNQQKEKWNKLLLTYEYWRDNDQIARDQWKTGEDETGFDGLSSWRNSRQHYSWRISTIKRLISLRSHNILKGKREWTNPATIAGTHF